MRIGLFHCDLPQHDRKPGGVSLVTHRLANALAADRRDHVTVFSLDTKPCDGNYQHVRLFANQPWLLQSKFAHLLITPLALSWARFDNIDVLHLHGDDWFYFNRRIPTVRTFHGSALREAQSAKSFKRQISQYLTYAFERLSSRLASVCLAVGEDAYRLYDADQVINNGVDLQFFHPGEKAAEPTVLFVGTWGGRKRGEFLMREFSRCVLPAIPSARLIMVSDYCEPAANVVWLKRPDDSELAELYRKAWVFASPSVYEGFGVGYVEAMASSTAVLASPNSGASYVLQRGQAGLIVADHEFAPQLCQLLRDTALRHKFELAGMSRASQFGWESVAHEHRRLYEQAITVFRGNAGLLTT